MHTYSTDMYTKTKSTIKTTLNVKVCGAHTIIQHPPLCVQTSQTRPRLCITKHSVIFKHETFVLAMYRIIVSQHTHKVIFAKLRCALANAFTRGKSETSD